MKVAITRFSERGIDDNFRNFCLAVNHHLCIKGFQTHPAGIDFRFACQVPTGFESEDIPGGDAVTVRYTHSSDPHELTYIQHLVDAVKKAGQDCQLCPCNEF